MNSRIGTELYGFSLNVCDITGRRYINNVVWNGYGEAPYGFIKKVNTPCQVEASYKLEFYDRFSHKHEVIHTINRKIIFWIVPNDMEIASKIIKTIQKDLKSQEKPYKDILVINNRGYQVHPKYHRRLPKKLYDFFNNTYEKCLTK